VIDVLQNHFFGFGVFNLVLLDNIVLVDRLHGEEFLGIFLLHK
jgi:hypothetical protein